MELGSQIKKHRMGQDLSQEDLAAKIYVSRQTVSNWETDKTYPDVENLLLLSVLFDVTIDELIKGDVEAMKEALAEDWKKIRILSWGGLVIALVGVATFLGGVSFWNWDIVPSALLGLLIWGIGMVMLVKVEHLKKEHDLVTYRELIAFSKGEPIDRSNPRSQQARKHRILKIIAMTLAGAIVGGCAGYFGYLFFG